MAAMWSSCVLGNQGDLLSALRKTIDMFCAFWWWSTWGEYKHQHSARTSAGLTTQAVELVRTLVAQVEALEADGSILICRLLAQTFQPFNISTFQPFNTSTFQHSPYYANPLTLQHLLSTFNLESWRLKVEKMKSGKTLTCIVLEESWRVETVKISYLYCIEIFIFRFLTFELESSKWKVESWTLKSRKSIIHYSIFNFQHWKLNFES